MAPRNQTLWLALAAAGFAAVLLLVWIPLDVQTGIVEQSRRRTVVGDSLAPAIAGVFILLGAVLLALRHRRESTPGMSRHNVGFIVALIAIAAFAFALMRWTGPVAAQLMGLEYRLLRVDYPWKVIGFVSGGWVMVFGLIALAERRASVRGALVAAAIVALLIAAYDLPFDDLLLPPNGDF